jgi:hypothetical protein
MKKEPKKNKKMRFITFRVTEEEYRILKKQKNLSKHIRKALENLSINNILEGETK